MKRGGIEWQTASEAIRTVTDAKAKGRPLLGIDAAFITDSGTRPSIEHSRDYTARPHSGISDRYDDAIRFINGRRSHGLHFEVVLG